jgi:hypothetical protein
MEVASAGPQGRTAQRYARCVFPIAAIETLMAEIIPAGQSLRPAGMSPSPALLGLARQSRAWLGAVGGVASHSGLDCWGIVL